MSKLTAKQRAYVMSTLKSKDDEIMLELKDFQQKTVKRIDYLFRHGQDRVLVADEVGLGKTMIAKGVLSKLAICRCDEGDDLVKVVYICSNQSIAIQNLKKLDIYGTGYDNISDTRLSMQHLKVMQQELKSKRENKYVQLIPLTPATSFQSKGRRAGTISERALMFSILEYLLPSDARDLLYKIMKGYAPGGWDGQCQVYKEEIERISSKTHERYPANVLREVKRSKEYKSLVEYLLHEEKTSHNNSRQIGNLREMFARISIGMLNPDLVIMDEFQRFQFMLQRAEGENKLLSEKFLQAKSNRTADKVRVLLLSATPYKLYSTLEEVGDNGAETSYREFLSVMRFLKGDNASEFETLWREYSSSLKHIENSEKSLNRLRLCSNKAGESMYECMCRTERLSVMESGDFVDDSSKDRALSIGRNDIRAYQEFSRVIDAIGLDKHVQVDFIKSCPYLLSFMQSYKLKQRINSFFAQGKHADLIDHCQSDALWLKSRRGLHHIPANNARLARLMEVTIGDAESCNKRKAEDRHLLLWMPPSLPYYESEGVYKGKEQFTKTLVFSSWEMVPRMISCMVSHEVESRVTINGYLPKPRLRKEAATTQLLYTCYPELADLYQPKEFIQQGVTKLKDIEKIIEKRLASLCNLPDFDNDVLVDIAISSPANCFYRIFKDKQRAERLAEKFVDYLNTSVKTAIIEHAIEKRGESSFHWRNVLTYCKHGNLQAVLDEYVYVLTNGFNIESLENEMRQKKWDDVQQTISRALEIHATSYTVDTFARFRDRHLGIKDKQGKEDAGSRMRSHYATAFAKGIGEDKADRKVILQGSFNSPFWPFVLASTSIGQEGLDFHQYCRQIMHWNLPTNPIDLEQREGRINRYKCLAIRQNIALKYGQAVISKWAEQTTTDVWNLLFDAAKAEKKDGQSELIPFWCLGKNQKVKIERIIANYPISIDEARYERLIEVLSLYRLTMGQVRQSELLDTVFREFDDPSVMKQFFINLSPFSKEI